MLVKHTSDYNLFTDCQNGFREKRNCVLWLTDVTDDLANAFDKSYQSNVIYTNIKKVLDIVPHRRLLLKLQTYK